MNAITYTYTYRYILYLTYSSTHLLYLHISTIFTHSFTYTYTDATITRKKLNTPLHLVTCLLYYRCRSSRLQSLKKFYVSVFEKKKGWIFSSKKLQIYFISIVSSVPVLSWQTETIFSPYVIAVAYSYFSWRFYPVCFPRFQMM